MKRILVVGAGFSGGVVARELAEAGYRVDVIDSRAHVGGNCYTETDAATGVTVHTHGPHIFHTDNTEVWDYIGRFGEMVPYILRVKATTRGRVFSLPINLLTINQFFGRTLDPAGAKAFIASLSDASIDNVETFEQQALKFLGPALYEAFFRGYPIKQWGYHPRELPASVLKRLPIRFNYDDNYFLHKYQAIPRHGYTQIIANILNHPGVSVTLGRSFDRGAQSEYSHVFYSGPLDGWFEYRLGRLGYRTLDFVESRHAGDFQGCAVMSYPDEDVPFTRITEHKHFAPWEEHAETIIFHEYSRYCSPGDVPYYPIRLAGEEKMLRNYLELAASEEKVSFIGRLGTYRYLDMDVTIGEALLAAREFIRLDQAGAAIPPLFVDAT